MTLLLALVNMSIVDQIQSLNSLRGHSQNRQCSFEIATKSPGTETNDQAPKLVSLYDSQAYLRARS